MQRLISTNSWNVELEVAPSGSGTQTAGKTILTLIEATDIADIID